MVNGVFALLNIKGSAEPFVSESELKLVLSGAAKSGQVDSEEREMIQNVLEMGETPVREVMTPLVRVVGVDQSASLTDLQEIWRTHR
jgi:CBS domain containing-hemolysin-like protein